MGKRKRTIENINAEIEYIIYLLNVEHLSKGEEGLKERLTVLEKEMLEKGGMNLIANDDSAIIHAMKNGKALCGANFKNSYIRVGIKPTCQRCLWSLGKAISNDITKARSTLARIDGEEF